MWTLLWRSVLDVVGLSLSGGAFVLNSVMTDPFWLTVLNTGGWFLVGVLSVVSIGLLVAGTWPAIRRLGGPDRPWRHSPGG